jgi:hypothetical protein
MAENQAPRIPLVCVLDIIQCHLLNAVCWVQGVHRRMCFIECAAQWLDTAKVYCIIEQCNDALISSKAVCCLKHEIKIKT